MFKWLYPGIGIKRWVIFAACGVILVVFGSSRLQNERYVFVQVLDLIILASGIIILILGIARMMRSFLYAVMPDEKDTQIVDILLQRKNLGKGARIVAVGGGTGLSALLSGLKEYSSNISAIVTVADDGGSSGRLRQQFDILPPGDIRNCLVALADAPALMRDLFQFRFLEGSEFAGHSFGNLFITAMTQVTGDFEKAIKETSRVLALRGQVIPSTLNNVVLAAKHCDGAITEGEEKIPKAQKKIARVFLRPSHNDATPEALRAIEDAQIIILGPGSLYTSIIPNLLIKDITEAIVRSNALKIYVCNVMTQPGETDGYKASDHAKALIEHSHPKVFNYTVVHVGPIPSGMRQRYEQEKAYPVTADSAVIRALGYRVIEENIISTEGAVRHEPLKLAKIIMDFFDEY